MASPSDSAGPSSEERDGPGVTEKVYNDFDEIILDQIAQDEADANSG